MLTVLAGVVALLCLGAVGIGYLVYDEATAPDRSAPDVAVDNYLRALLVERNDTRTTAFVCPQGGSLGAIRDLRNEIERREREFDVSVRVSWGSLTRAAVSATEEQVTTELTLAGFTNGQQTSRRTETWEFLVVDNDGWRICSAQPAG